MKFFFIGLNALSKAEEIIIKELIEIYAEDAKICEEIGFDGVEIHGAHGYLMINFFGIK